MKKKVLAGVKRFFQDISKQWDDINSNLASSNIDDSTFELNILDPLINLSKTIETIKDNDDKEMLQYEYHVRLNKLIEKIKAGKQTKDSLMPYINGKNAALDRLVFKENDLIFDDEAGKSVYAILNEHVQTVNYAPRTGKKSEEAQSELRNSKPMPFHKFFKSLELSDESETDLGAWFKSGRYGYDQLKASIEAILTRRYSIISGQEKVVGAIAAFIKECLRDGKVNKIKGKTTGSHFKTNLKFDVFPTDANKAKIIFEKLLKRYGDPEDSFEMTTQQKNQSPRESKSNSPVSSRRLSQSSTRSGVGSSPESRRVESPNPSDQAELGSKDIESRQQEIDSSIVKIKQELTSLNGRNYSGSRALKLTEKRDLDNELKIILEIKRCMAEKSVVQKCDRLDEIIQKNNELKYETMTILNNIVDQLKKSSEFKREQEAKQKEEKQKRINQEKEKKAQTNAKNIQTVKEFKKLSEIVNLLKKNNELKKHVSLANIKSYLADNKRREFESLKTIINTLDRQTWTEPENQPHIKACLNYLINRVDSGNNKKHTDLNSLFQEIVCYRTEVPAPYWLSTAHFSDHKDRLTPKQKVMHYKLTEVNRWEHKSLSDEWGKEDSFSDYEERENGGLNTHIEFIADRLKKGPKLHQQRIQDSRAFWRRVICGVSVSVGLGAVAYTWLARQAEEAGWIENISDQIRHNQTDQFMAALQSNQAYVQANSRQILKEAIQHGRDHMGAMIVGSLTSFTDIMTLITDLGKAKCVETIRGLWRSSWSFNETVVTDRIDRFFLESIKEGNLAPVQMLIDEGINIEYKNVDGQTPLMLACEHGYDEIVKALIKQKSDWDKNFDLDVQDQNGATALMIAIEKRNDQIAERLIAAGADLDIRNKDKFTPLMIAIKKRNNGIAERLIAESAKGNINIDIVNNIGSTALMVAIKEENDQIAERLIAESANRNINHDIVSKFKFTALDIANNIGSTALMIAIEKRNDQIAERLIASGADLDITNKVKSTALMIAAHNGNNKIVKLLIDAGANLNLKNSDGDTALRIAEITKNREIIKLIQSAMNRTGNNRRR